MSNHNNNPLKPKRYSGKTKCISFKVLEDEYEELAAALQYRKDKGYISQNAGFRDLFMPMYYQVIQDPYADSTFDLDQ